MRQLIESMEGRLLLSAAAVDGSLALFADQQGDTLYLSTSYAERFVVSLHGDDSALYVAASDSDLTEFYGVTRLVVTLGGGGQTLNDISVMISKSVTGGSGDDQLNVFGNAPTITVSGGDGNDSLYVDGGTINVSGGDGDDSANVRAYTSKGAPGGSADVTLGRGNDVADVIAGALKFDGGDGSDALNFSSLGGTVLGGQGTDYLQSVLWDGSGDITGNLLNGQADADIIMALASDKVVGAVKSDAITIVG